MIKKVVIFAAGRGTRMKNLSTGKPKHLIEIFNKPFLYYLLSNLKQAGFTEYIIVTGYLAGQIEEFLENYKEEFPNYQVINQFEKLGKEKYGTLMPLLAVQSSVGDEDFVVVMGDNLYSLDDLKAFREKEDKYCYVGGYRVSNPERYGTLVTNTDGQLDRIDERCPKPVSDLINSGIYKFNSEIFKVVNQVEISPRGEYEITDAITFIAQDKKVKVISLKEYWLDFGRPEDIVKMEKFIEKLNLFEIYGIKK